MVKLQVQVKRELAKVSRTLTPFSTSYVTTNEFQFIKAKVVYNRIFDPSGMTKGGNYRLSYVDGKVYRPFNASPSLPF